MFTRLAIINNSFVSTSADYSDGDSESQPFGEQQTASGGEETAKVVSGVYAKRTLTAWKMVFIGYFLTCGGPFGIEPSVKAVGPLVTLIGLMFWPIIWSLPQAILGAELALMYKENGGAVVWVQEAFGDFFGWMNAHNCLGYLLSSLAALVVLFVTYIPLEFTWWEEWLIKVGFVFLCVLVNIFGLGIVSSLSIVFMFAIMSPFIVMALVVAFQYEYKDTFSEITAGPRYNLIELFERKEIGVFIGTMVYAYGGFDSLGAFAGEVRGGRRTFLAGILGILPVNMINYIIPLIAAYTISPHPEKWDSGYFGDVAYKSSTWLGTLILISSGLSNFGYTNVLALVARTMWAMAKPKHQAKKLPTFIYSMSLQSSPGSPVRPIAAIIVSAVGSLIVAAFPFTIILELILVLRIVNLLLEYAALIKLKYTNTNPRIFEVPGGKLGAWLLPVTTVIVCIAELALGNYLVILAGVVFNLVVAMLFFVFRLGRMARHKVQSNNRKKKGGVIINNIQGDDDVAGYPSPMRYT